MSRRVKSKPRSSQSEMGSRVFVEFEEVKRRREQWAEQQATREQLELEQVARQQGWTIREDR